MFQSGISSLFTWKIFQQFAVVPNRSPWGYFLPNGAVYSLRKQRFFFHVLRNNNYILFCLRYRKLQPPQSVLGHHHLHLIPNHFSSVRSLLIAFARLQICRIVKLPSINTKKGKQALKTWKGSVNISSPFSPLSYLQPALLWKPEGLLYKCHSDCREHGGPSGLKHSLLFNTTPR